jgi:farnesyl diphosphate synthase
VSGAPPNEREWSEFLEQARLRVEAYLDRHLPPADAAPALLHEAMRYAVLSGGKRLRPALAYATAVAYGAKPEAADAVAAAAELVHTYSLVHDDLPAMDDDAKRRGRPTVHVRYGEANAILVGDALQAEAFRCLARDGAGPEVVEDLALAAGSGALVGGQVDDLAFDPAHATLESVTSIHERKTAAMFEFSICGAARRLAPDGERRAALGRFARCYGLAFLTPDEARARAERHVALACEALAPFGRSAYLLRAAGESLPGRLS